MQTELLILGTVSLVLIVVYNLIYLKKIKIAYNKLTGLVKEFFEQMYVVTIFMFLIEITLPLYMLLKSYITLEVLPLLISTIYVFLIFMLFIEGLLLLRLLEKIQETYGF